MRLPTRPDKHALAGVYALDAVTGRERERFMRHLASCPECEQEVRGLQETATRFALAASTPPPRGLRDWVLAEAAGTRQLPAVPEMRQQPQRGTTVTRRLAIPLAVVGSAAAIVLGVLLGISRSELGSETAQQRSIDAVLDAPGDRIISARTSLGGSASVVVAGSLHELVFTGRGLRGLPDAEVYQLWVLGPAGTATAISDGLLARAPNGTTTPTLASGLAVGDRIGVTVEPAGGTAKPTTTPILLISLPS
jgi:anti-sigma-K factor RskA